VEIDELDLTGRQMKSSADGSKIYVCGAGAATYVEVFRTLDLAKDGELDTEQPALFVALSPDGSQAYVASSMQLDAQSNSAATYVTGFSTTSYARIDEQLSLGGMKDTSLAFSPDGGKLYVVVDNPYRITDNPYGDLRQDLQILELR
jgi:DNA-binding beta-propeller fold protein YncE